MSEGRISTVRLNFVGSFYRRAGSEQQELEIKLPADLQAAKFELKKKIEDNIGKDVLYAVLLNGVNIALVKGSVTSIAKGDKFSVVPIILGG